jgi:hypothetical protein
MASSGIRVGAIPSLTLKSLKRLDDGLGILTVYAKSKKSTYDTLVTQECISTLDEYLVQRKEFGETLNGNSLLIRDKYSIFSKRVNRPAGLTAAAFNVQMRFLVRKAALPFEELQPDHALRKFFDTTLINSNVDPKFKEMLMGHSIKLDDVYYDKKSEISSNKLRLEYMKAADALTINNEFRLRKQIAEAEDKLKYAPKLEKLQEQLASKMIEQDSIKRAMENLQKEQQEQVKLVGSQLQSIISIIADSDYDVRNKWAKLLVKNGIFKPGTNPSIDYRENRLPRHEDNS